MKLTTGDDRPKAALGKRCNVVPQQGIEKCNSFVLDENKDAIEFWIYNGWTILDYDYRTLQMKTDL